MIIDILNYELNINSLGMVRSPNGEIELGVDDFLKLIDSRIDQYVVRKDPLSNHFDIKYAASVHKNKKEYVIEVKDYDGIYHLNLGSNPKLAKKFDKFCEITEKNEAQIENYDKLYLEKDDEKIDYPSAVDYIKKARKSNGKHLAFLVSLFSTGVLSCALGCDVLLYDYSSIVANGALLPAAIICGGAVLLGAPIAVFATNFIQNPHDNFFTKIAKTFKFDRYLSRQAERAKKIANSAEKTMKCLKLISLKMYIVMVLSNT